MRMQVPLQQTAAVDGASGPLAGAAANGTGDYAALNAEAEFQTVVDVFDSLGAKHTLTLFFYSNSATTNQYLVRAYADSADVDTTAPPATGEPMQVLPNGGATAASGTITLNFDNSGQLVTGGTYDLDF